MLNKARVCLGMLGLWPYLQSLTGSLWFMLEKSNYLTAKSDDHRYDKRRVFAGTIDINELCTVFYQAFFLLIMLCVIVIKSINPIET